MRREGQNFHLLPQAEVLCTTSRRPQLVVSSVVPRIVGHLASRQLSLQLHKIFSWCLLILERLFLLQDHLCFQCSSLYLFCKIGYLAIGSLQLVLSILVGNSYGFTLRRLRSYDPLLQWFWSRLKSIINITF